MNSIKKYLGIVWMVIAFAAIVLLVQSAFAHVNHGKEDINKPTFWVIIITIFTPIAIGLALFGWYSLKGEYNNAK